MAKLLYIESSPRKERSASIAISKYFLDEYLKAHPADGVAVVDLWNKDLPSFDGEVINAKYAIMHGKETTPEQKRAWKPVENLITEFKSADKYVISLPMWNFTIPYRLKHYIDALVQPGYTFTFSPESGYQGLVTGKKMLLIFARGGAYGPETGAQQLDFQKSYMETILGFIGFKDIESIVIEPTMGGNKEAKEAMMKQCQEKAAAFAHSF
ncbi:MAG: NAD(P)H-dependent oxidoreductase [Verrucomicrobia bacterium]|nr:NAD(P)H-dependent oxidoreductase [Verrucomicrobiota bacterium]